MEYMENLNNLEKAERIVKKIATNPVAAHFLLQFSRKNPALGIRYLGDSEKSPQSFRLKDLLRLTKKIAFLDTVSRKNLIEWAGKAQITEAVRPPMLPFEFNFVTGKGWQRILLDALAEVCLIQANFLAGHETPRRAWDEFIAAHCTSLVKLYEAMESENEKDWLKAILETHEKGVVWFSEPDSYYKPILFERLKQITQKLDIEGLDPSQTIRFKKVGCSWLAVTNSPEGPDWDQFKTTTYNEWEVIPLNKKYELTTPASSWGGYAYTDKDSVLYVRL